MVQTCYGGIFVVIFSALLAPIQAYAGEVDETDTITSTSNLRDTTLQELFNCIRANNPDISEDTAMEIALSMLEKSMLSTENAYSSSSHMPTSSSDSGRTIICLGKIVDGELAAGTVDTCDLGNDYWSVLSEGWLETPHIVNTIYDRDYPSTWVTADNYRSSGLLEIYAEVSLEASVTEKYEGSLSLSKNDALKFGLTVSNTKTITAQITAGTKLTAPAWTIVSMRPYVHFRTDYYEGTYQYYCYDGLTNQYFYITDVRNSNNTSVIEYGIQTWSRENTAHNSYAVSPIPPTSWT